MVSIKCLTKVLAPTSEIDRLAAITQEIENIASPNAAVEAVKAQAGADLETAIRVGGVLSVVRDKMTSNTAERWFAGKTFEDVAEDTFGISRQRAYERVNLYLFVAAVQITWGDALAIGVSKLILVSQDINVAMNGGKLHALASTLSERSDKAKAMTWRELRDWLGQAPPLAEGKKPKISKDSPVAPSQPAMEGMSKSPDAVPASEVIKADQHGGTAIDRPEVNPDDVMKVRSMMMNHGPTYVLEVLRLALPHHDVTLTLKPKALAA